MKVYIKFLKEIEGRSIYRSQIVILPVGEIFKARIYPFMHGEGLRISVSDASRIIDYMTDTPDGLTLGEDFEITSTRNFHQLSLMCDDTTNFHQINLDEIIS